MATVELYDDPPDVHTINVRRQGELISPKLLTAVPGQKKINLKGDKSHW